MSPLSRQPTIFLTGEPNSDPFWIDGVACSTFHEETLRLFEGVTTSLERSAPLPTDHPLPSLDDVTPGPPPTFFGGTGGADGVPFTFAPSTMSFGVQTDDLFYHTYQAICNELLQDEYETRLPAQVMEVYEVPPRPPTARDDSVDSITQTLSRTHLPSEPVDCSAVTAAYASSFDRSCDSGTPSTPEEASIASPTTDSSPSSSRHDGSKQDGEGDTDSDEDEEYRPTQAASSQMKKGKVCVRAKSTRTRSSTSRSKNIGSSRAHRRSHPYREPISSRNFQRQDSAGFVNKASVFQCPVAECDYIQKNKRIPDLNRHVMTHDRWMEPERWTCCGVGVEIAHLYGRGIEAGLSKEEQIEAGAYVFKGELMVGGCLKTFARRDSLKRHVDNPKMSCVGDMDSYLY